MSQLLASPNCLGANRIFREQESPICRKINNFFVSPAYFLLIGVLTVISNVFSLELAVYTCFILIGLYLSLCGKDYLPLIPIVICCYIAPSVDNNPGRNDNSIFYPQNGGIYLLCLAGLFLLSVILRLRLDPQLGFKAFLRCKRKLLPGMLVLGCGYLLSGVFSGHYFDNGGSNLLFAFIQFVAVFTMYFVFTGAVKWEDAPKEYFAWTGMCVGLVLLAELLHIYTNHEVIVKGVIQRSQIYSGWGICNNIGALLAMMIPFPFWMACTRKKHWVYHLCALLFLVGVVLTCSRASIIFATIIYLLSYSIAIYKEIHVKRNILGHIIAFAVIIVLLVVFREQLFLLFRGLLDRGLDPSNRIEIYIEGLKQFAQNPIFGGSFYAIDYSLHDYSKIEAFSSFFPPRWHNTVVQLLASGGIVGFAAYGFHRYQTVKLFFKQQSLGKGLIALSILALLGTSLLDCHFFNVGPTLFYSMALAFAEKADTRQDDW